MAKIDSRTLAKHLRTVSMNKLVEGVALGTNFTVTVVDASEQVLLHGETNQEFKPGFGVADVAHLAKIVESFGEEMDIAYEEQDGKLIMTGNGVVVRYQAADPDVVQRKKPKWKSALDALSEGVIIEGSCAPGFIKQFDKYYKLVKPQLVELELNSGDLIARLISEKSHQAEVVMGPAKKTSKAKTGAFKVDAKTLASVLSCVPERVMGEDGEVEDPVTIEIGKSLSIEFDSYRFFISPVVDTPGVTNGIGESKAQRDDF
jgi:hypothetical protein